MTSLLWVIGYDVTVMSHRSWRRRFWVIGISPWWCQGHESSGFPHESSGIPHDDVTAPERPFRVLLCTSVVPGNFVYDFVDNHVIPFCFRKSYITLLSASDTSRNHASITGGAFAASGDFASCHGSVRDAISRDSSRLMGSFCDDVKWERKTSPCWHPIALMIWHESDIDSVI